MSVLSAQTIRRLGLVEPCREAYRCPAGYSAGLSACGYDLTLGEAVELRPGRFVLAVSAERLVLPADVVGIVHDKSSLARLGLAVQNTVAEPGWRGYLTLELTNHWIKRFYMPAGAAVCQVLFHRLDEATELPYAGRYQDQGPRPQPSRRMVE